MIEYAGVIFTRRSQSGGIRGTLLNVSSKTSRYVKYVKIFLTFCRYYVFRNNWSASLIKVSRTECMRDECVLSICIMYTHALIVHKTIYNFLNVNKIIILIWTNWKSCLCCSSDEMSISSRLVSPHQYKCLIKNTLKFNQLGDSA